MVHTKYQGSRPCGIKQEDFFSCFPIYAYVLPVTQQGWAHFWPQGYKMNKLGGGPQDDDTYQILRL